MKMRLTQLRADLFGTLHYDLKDIPPCAVVIGPNASGKSVLLSLPVRLLSLPRNDTGWQIHGKWEDGDRTLVVDRKVDDAGHVVIYDMKTKIKAAQAAIERDIGTAWSWSASAWLAESARSRTKLLREFIQFHWDRDDARAQLSEAGIDLERLDELQRDYGWSADTPNGQVYLQGIIDGLRKTWAETTARIRRSRSAAEHAQHQLDGQQLPAGTVAQYEQHIQGAEERRRALSEQLGKARQEAKAAKQAAGQLQGKREALASLDLDEAAAMKVLQEAQAADAKLDADIAEATKQNEAKRAQWKEVFAEFQRIESAVRIQGEFVEKTIEVLDNLLQWTIVRESDEATVDIDAAHAWLAEAKTVASTTDDDVKAANGKETAAGRIWTRAEEALGTLRNKPRCTPAAQAHIDGLAERNTLADGLRADIARLEEEAQALQADQVTAIEQQMVALGVEVRGYVQNRDALNDAVQLRNQVDLAQGNATTAQSQRDMVREYGNIARLVHGRMCNQATAPLCEPASRITQTTLGMDIGFRMDDGTTLLLGGEPVDEHSESRQTIALAALQTAVQMQMHGWRAVLLDGLEHIDRDHRFRFMDALQAEVDAGTLDNVLCACVDDGWRWNLHASEGRSVITLKLPE
jgi:hypothetical protein